MLLINGAQASNVFWVVGSSATLGTTSIFAGNFLAFTSISINTGSSLNGRALARNGAVTMDTNIVTVPLLAAGDVGVSKTGPSTIVSGQNVVYTVIVTNNGSAAGVSVVVPTPPI